MSLGELLIQQLENCWARGDLPAPADQPVHIVATNTATVEVDATQIEGLGMAFNKLAVWTAAEAPGKAGNWLEQHGKAIAGQVTYLTESLALLECDGRIRRALLRSAPPRTTPTAVEYFEGWLDHDPAAGRLTFTLSRYRRGDGELARHPVSMIMTRDVFARLVDDLAAVLTPGDDTVTR
jgi:hypothetical protein